MEFADHADVEIPVTRCTAHFGGTSRRLDRPIGVVDLRTAQTDDSRQQSITPLHRANVVRLLPVAVAPPRRQAYAGLSASPAGSTAGLVATRVGGPRFRAALLRRHGAVCAAAGECPAEVLKPAHLGAPTAHGAPDLDEGLLLCADIHVLFDRCLMTVRPSELTLRLAPRLRFHHRYRALQGRAIQVRAPVCPAAVPAHYRAAVGIWGTL
ncbi:HNH endonuclease [Actinosynnema sp. NPDC020468]|uniref:HNH endonuclease n=1 Tax=Actinosynnema sp. NPDC020468 TaxID=3154488 RepID=UPI003405978C